MWRPPPRDERNGRLTEFRVDFRPTKSSDSATVIEMVPAEDDRESYELVLDQLETWTDYTISVSASNSEGHGPFSETIVVRTDEDGRLFKRKKGGMERGSIFNICI